MKQPFIYDPSEALNHIQKVDAPPFMLTRIMQTVSNAYEQRITPTVAWAGSLLLVFVFAMNVWLISNKSTSEQNNNTAQLQSLAPFPNNSLYE